MARLVSAEQLAALQSADRSTYVRVKVEDPDGTLVNVCDLNGEDFLQRVEIDASNDYPISQATVVLWRRSGIYSIAPLIEASPINRDAGENYAPLVNPHRLITVDVATMPAMHPVTSSDWVELFRGYVDEVESGGFASQVTLHCRDILADLNDTIIETTGTYGDDATLPNVATVMQQILDDNETGLTLAVPVTPTFGVYSYDLGNVSILDGLTALRDLFGWNLHLRWSDIADAHQLTLYEPQRNQTTADWTIGPDDYFDVRTLNVAVAGIRNRIEVVYTDIDGVERTVSDEDGTSVGYYGRRFMRIDARGTSLTTETQASALVSALLSDLATPAALQEIESAFWWPLELGDMVTYTANGEHYDTDQTWATFAYRHVLSPDKARTFISARGKPSGGFHRWHGSVINEDAATVAPSRRGTPRTPRSVEVTFTPSGRAVVNATGDPRTRRLYVTVGDGEVPPDPTPASYDAVIEGTSGTVDTGVKITTGNRAFVKVVASDGSSAGLVAQTSQARSLGPFHKATSARTVTGTTSETSLQSVTVPADTLGTDGGLRLEARFTSTGTAGSKGVNIYWDGVQKFSIGLGSGSALSAEIEVLLFNDGATDSQYMTVVVHRTNGDTLLASNTASDDTTADVNLEIRGILGNSGDSLTLARSLVSYIGTD